MRKRVLCEKPPVDRKSMVALRGFARRYVAQWTRQNGVGRIATPDMDGWLAGLGPRLRRYEEFMEQEAYLGHTLSDDVSAHIKIELLPEEKAPRIIQARNEYYQYEFGPWIRSLEHALRDVPHPFLVKGLTAEGVAGRLMEALDEFRDPVVIETDYSSFDATIGVGLAGATQHEWFKWFFPAAIAGRLQTSHSFRGRSPSGTPYKAAMRASGDPHTSIGNAVINHTVTKFVAAVSGVSCRSFVEGDDGFTIIERADVQRWDKDVYAKLGLKVKIAFHDPIEATFCSRRLWLRGDGRWTVLRSPARILSKVPWTCSPLAMSRKHREPVRRGMAICAYLETRGIPVLQAFGLMLLRATDAAVVPEFGDHRALEWLNFEEYEPIPVSMEARQHFYERTGVSPSAQVAAEAVLGLDQPRYQHPVFDTIFQSSSL